MNHAAAESVSIFCEDTGDWVEMSPEARLISLEITRKKGSLTVGHRGLPALLELLHLDRFWTWDYVRPHVEWLLEHGKLVFDQERREIFDPQHETRQEAARGHRPRTPSLRSPVEAPPAMPALEQAPAPRAFSNTPGAIYQRERRARIAAEKHQSAPQLSLGQLMENPSASAHDDRHDATTHVTTRTTRENSSSSVDDSSPSSRVVSNASAPTTITTGIDDRHAPLSVKAVKQKPAERGEMLAFDAPIEPDAQDIFDEIVDRRRVRMDIEHVWGKFVAWSVKKRWRFLTRAVVMTKWRQWVDEERAPPLDDAPARASPKNAPPKPRPKLETAMPLSKTVAESLASSLANGDFESAREIAKQATAG